MEGVPAVVDSPGLYREYAHFLAVITYSTNAENVLLSRFSTKREEPLAALVFDLAEKDLDQMWKMNLYLPTIEQYLKDSTKEGEDLHATVPACSIDGYPFELCNDQLRIHRLVEWFIMNGVG